MFNKKRGSVLYYALGIAGAVIMAAGTGTYFFVSSRKNSKRAREMTAQAKRVIHKATTPKRSTKTANSKANHSNHHTNGHNASR